MGFLDHSTNNIIIDAVLTDRGRELLSANDGSFRVVRYAFSDDEVDYSIIKKSLDKLFTINKIFFQGIYIIIANIYIFKMWPIFG